MQRMKFPDDPPSNDILRLQFGGIVNASPADTIRFGGYNINRSEGAFAKEKSRQRKKKDNINKKQSRTVGNSIGDLTIAASCYVPCLRVVLLRTF